MKSKEELAARSKDRKLIEGARRLAQEIMDDGKLPEDLEPGELAYMLETLANQLHYYMYKE